MKNKPLVSVIIPTYNRPKNLERAIKSVINQKYKNIEIIIVNDYPSVKIKNEWGSKVKIINHKKNQGSAATRNFGIKTAKGKYLAFLDDDDLWLPKKIEAQVKVMEKSSSKWVGVYSWCFKANSLKDYKDEKIRLIKCQYEGDFTFELLSGAKNFYIGAGSSLLVKRRVVKELNGFDKNFVRHTDYEFMIRLLKKGGIKLIKEPLWINIGQLNISNINVVEDSKFRLLNKFKTYINSLEKDKKNKIYAHQFLELSALYLLDLNFVKSIRYFIKSISFFPTLLPLRNYLVFGKYFFKGIKKKIFFIYKFLRKDD